MKISFSGLLTLSLVLACSGAAASASTPPMGWNSYDAYGTTVNEAQLRANALWMSRHLKQYGWRYLVVDMQWYVRNPTPPGNAPGAIVMLDSQGRYIPAPNRFPSAANGAGFAPLAAYVHSLGLGFGIHILRGIPREAVKRDLPIADSPYRAGDAADSDATCPWNPDNFGLIAGKPAAQAYYNSIADLYASWGVDFVKADCLASKPYSGEDIRMLSSALKNSDHEVILSVSPGPAPFEALQELRRDANLWRISNDVWDIWNSSGDYPKGLADVFPLAALWAPEARADAWPDADMLAVGYLGPAPGWGAARVSRLSDAEQRTLITLWCISRSPLMIGANLTRMNVGVRRLLTNREVIDVDQHSTGARLAYQDGELLVWTATPVSTTGRYIAIFNLGETPLARAVPWALLGIEAPVLSMRDLWLHQDLTPQPALKVGLAAHASNLYRIAIQ